LDFSDSPVLPLYHDLALLAFIKCHATTLPRWKALVALCRRPERWVDPAHLSSEEGRAEGICQALADLAGEGVVERRTRADGKTLYRLGRQSTTSILVSRLMVAIRHRQELRQILAAHLVQAQPRPALASTRS
jgi:hypothetical protein